MSYASLGATGGEQWLILWSTIPGKQTYFVAWVWTNPATAALLNRTARGAALSQDHEQYRLEGPMKPGYVWYRLQGTTWGNWWSAKHIAWVYTSGEGFMAVNGSLSDEVDACNRLQLCNLLAAPGGPIL
jgi:hypothetical protein